MSVTIKDIAAAAGVSRGTVDRVINKRGGVKPGVEARIQNLIKEMGYVPNKAGKVLAALKKPMIIGCVLPSVNNPFFADVILGMQKAADELKDFGVSVLIKQVKGFNPISHIAAVYELLDEGISALCISTVDVPQVRETVNEVVAKGIPVVTINSDLEHTGRVCYVGGNYVENGRTAAGIFSLLKKDPLNILVLTGSLNMKGHNQRISGFINTLREKGRKFNILDIVESMDDDDTAYKKTKQALKNHPDVTCLYITAAGVQGTCNAVMESNIKDNITIVSFDDTPAIKKLLYTGVISATICQEPIEQGYKAVRILYDCCRGNALPESQFYFTDTVIKIRENI